jgi:hypothetical protein
MDETREGERTWGRSIQVSAWGNSKDELELAALDTARDFFGGEVRLEVVPDYQVFSYEQDPKGRYNANVTVAEIRP